MRKKETKKDRKEGRKTDGTNLNKYVIASLGWWKSSGSRREDQSSRCEHVTNDFEDAIITKYRGGGLFGKTSDSSKPHFCFKHFFFVAWTMQRPDKDNGPGPMATGRPLSNISCENIDLFSITPWFPNEWLLLFYMTTSKSFETLWTLCQKSSVGICLFCHWSKLRMTCFVLLFFSAFFFLNWVPPPSNSTPDWIRWPRWLLWILHPR